MNKKVQKVIDGLSKKYDTHKVKVLGGREDQKNAFAILMRCGHTFSSTKENEYFGLTNETMDAFKEAGIKFRVIG